MPSTDLAPASAASALGWPDDRYLTRPEAAKLLTAMGLAVKARTIESWYTRRSDGPPCYHLNGRAFYRAGDLRAWLAEQLAKPTRSKAELT